VEVEEEVEGEVDRGELSTSTKLSTKKLTIRNPHLLIHKLIL